MRNFLKSLEVNPENYGLLGSIYFSLFTSGIMTVMLGTVLPYIRQENALTYSQNGILLSAHQIGTVVTVLVIGVLPYMIGRKKATVILGSGMVIGLVSMTVFKTPWALAAAFAFTGIGRGTMTNICNVVAADVSGNKTGALNLLHAVFSAGALLSPVIVFVFTGALGFGWKMAALFAASLSLTAIVLIAFSGLANAPARAERSGTASFLKNRAFWVNTMILFFYICAEASIMGWFVTYFEDLGILSPSAAKFTPALLWLMMMIGRISCSILSPRINMNRLLLMLSLAFTASFVLLMTSRSAPVCMVSLSLIGVSMAGIYPTTLAAMRGTITTLSTGFMIAIASVGGIIMPGIVGAVADTYGLFGGVASILLALAGMTVLTFIKLITAKNE